ncbi:3-alpha,7-alpha,12-alpha-trihydroxy-5-beta-cholest-24-enoyl-CoA hydratase [Allosaccharopolyspora coralli]|uniref:3-alpha,7-alpha, 12-alpha-trihydroxy-5-beta-cholest-24-enoyl-CoA hydratase n=1 Tax=Allosaccharopolyspora coralli TaxID=2665642 RepID=A0A5Q3Q6U1_9PSEU|nr:MaoC/PaaZ C-terminal domain-containing protein [Allosaccharopolyspora coralli]QGK70381.1 3-alpha,7-alpha,12-alpha-trihydroxy-5-beta-cholest-24-enoyl-CoA hydratase [Allosaccharopolyspora coralli]
MPIDPDQAIGAVLPTQEFGWSSSDVLLYHLAVGAGADSVDPRELRYVTESDLQVLPTFAIVAPNFHRSDPPEVSFPGVEIDLANVLHGSQEIEVHRPLPTDGKATARTHIADVQDKGTAAVIVQETVTSDLDGTPLCTTRSSIFARGEGGFGGNRGSSPRFERPARTPEVVLDSPTLPQQALLYRLCGDRNPLHSDPAFAEAAGFPRPILHGLCTYGMVGKAIVDELAGADVTRLRSYGVRFAGVVFPGETVRTELWREGHEWVGVSSVPAREDAPVLSDIRVTTDD